MTIPIYKKTIFDTMGNRKQEIAEEIEPRDKVDVSRLIEMFLRKRDARGRWEIPQKEGMELLVYFKKYVDPKASNNIFGCGGCAAKMVDYMSEVYKLWQSPIK